MNSPERERWVSLATVFGAREANEWYERLTAAYAEPQRHYHNHHHIAECLREFDEARSLLQNPARVELAIWFHDAVYDPRASDNEEQSAALADQFLRSAGASDEACAVVKRLVMATKHHAATTPDEALLIDIDLSILGQDRERFAEYERQIREEYSWVPAAVFAEKRSQILQRFLARTRIYASGHFFDCYESRARQNLQWSIGQLGHGPQ
jgi:predicted metal-dependent HD superfamily phosphohydrolase